MRPKEQSQCKLECIVPEHLSSARIVHFVSDIAGNRCHGIEQPGERGARWSCYGLLNHYSPITVKADPLNHRSALTHPVRSDTHGRASKEQPHLTRYSKRFLLSRWNLGLLYTLIKVS